MATYSVLIFKAVDLPKEYEGMIFSKWLRSLRYGNDFFKMIDPDAYWANYEALVQRILRAPETEVRLAVLSDDHDVVLGFSVSRGTALDYVHVHNIQRRQGIGKNLVPPGITTITHVTNTALTIWGSKYGEWKFNPFA